MDSITAQKIADLFDHAKGEALSLLRRDEETRAAASSQSVAVDDDEGISVAEAAKMLGVKKWRVYEMVRQKILPAYKPSPRTLRIRRGAVREFIATGRCTIVEQAGGAQPLRLQSQLRRHPHGRKKETKKEAA